MTKGWAGLFATAFRSSQNPMALSDDRRRIIEVNGALAQLLGHPPSRLRGTHTWEYVVDGPLLSHEQWRDAIARDEVTGVGDLRCADGSVVRVQFGIHPEVVTGRRLVLFVGLALPRWGRHVRRPIIESEAARELSRREREVLELVARGATSPEIAAALHISANTVRKHVNSAMRKLGARSRAHLVAKALGEGRLERADALVPAQIIRTG